MTIKLPRNNKVNHTLNNKQRTFYLIAVYAETDENPC
jgi:hypothetical protein